MSAPCQNACSQWAEVADVGPPCSDYGFPSDLLDDALAIASDLLFELSGRRFPGSCRDVVRPCSRSIYEPNDYYVGGPYLSVGQVGGRTWGGWCSCNRRQQQCGCSRLSELSLGAGPVSSIIEVKLDGAVLDPSRYRIDDFRWLVRLADEDGTNPGWPCCQRLDLDSGEADTFEVTFTYGTPPPPAGVWAAATLGCQLALAMNPDTAAKCKLPKRVLSMTRNGMTLQMLDPQTFLEKGKTGIYEVDLFLAAYNPNGKRGRAQAVNVDLHKPVRRVDT